MSACFVELLGTGPGLLMGTDCPALTPERLRTAANALDRVDAFVIPAADGGYVLIGLRRHDPALFAAIRWGTDRVMAEIRERLAALQWSWAEGETLCDIDEAEDLIHLPADLDGVAKVSATGRMERSADPHQGQVPGTGTSYSRRQRDTEDSAVT
jgi:glycosyltransferase A (GT-A) superfamily protein (DUF2064 family)